jgi:hypothetical protein
MNKLINIFTFLTLMTYQLNAQNVGIGTATPAEKLDVSGNIRTTGEIKPNGATGQANQVLTSNGNGTMSWASMSQNNEEETGNGTWGDCSINNITGYQPVADEDAGDEDNFAASVAISGNYSVLGVPFDDNGGLTNCGSVVIMKRNVTNGIWEFHSKLFHSNPAAHNRFGYSVSISGDFIVVGSPYADIAGITDIGIASIYKRNTTTDVWEFMTNINNSNPETENYFGWSVSISGDYVIVGAPKDTENGLNFTGSASIFKYNNGTNAWQFQTKLINHMAAANDWFGVSVSISDDYIIAGATLDEQGSLIDSGSASIFKRNTTTNAWEFQTKLTDASFPSNYDKFGNSVSISGDYVVVGTELDDYGTCIECGSATIFKRNPSNGIWTFQKYITNVEFEAYSRFGSSVVISGDYVMIGAPLSNVDGFDIAGSVSIFKRYGTQWQAVQNFSTFIPNQGGQFGNSVALDKLTKRFLIGAVNSNGSTGMAYYGKIK